MQSEVVIISTSHRLWMCLRHVPVATRNTFGLRAPSRSIALSSTSFASSVAHVVELSTWLQVTRVAAEFYVALVHD